MDIKSSKCGCKGIRTCLLCEKEKGAEKSTSENERDTLVYNYCSCCNLCWPEEKMENALMPLYLGKIMLVSDFINKEEESYLVSSIDAIPWMPSQSGRKKQDFGPKANFKKKKVKIGEFKGFPTFAKDIIEKLQSIEELTNFLPVELCHLEYTPDRGSLIEPHVDDQWLWGSRLVTVNLLSTTVLTLTPTGTSSCLDWSEKMRCNYNSTFVMEKFTSELLNRPCGHKLSFTYTDSEDNKNKFQAPSVKEKNSYTVCGKKELSNFKVAVRITLPPRSLFVLSGCARCNWFHEIRRADVASRRLAMTFRELSENYLLGNFEKKKFGEEILEIAKNFCNFSEGNVSQV